MILSVTETLTLLSQIATTAQTSGLMPTGTPALVLAGLVTALQVALQSGVLVPGRLIEIDEIGDDFDAALVRMRAALATP